MADGYLNKCKICTRKDVDSRIEKLSKNPEWLIKESERLKRKHVRLDYKNRYKPDASKQSSSSKTYKEKYPEKYKAKNASGKLPRKQGCELHHWSYNEEHHKDVLELNREDHYLLHRFIKYDQEIKMYRKKYVDEILNSKESHILLLEELKSGKFL